MSNTFFKGYKYQIYPDEEQKILINEYVNMYRFVYNWGIAKEQKQYELYLNNKEKYSFINFFDLCMEFKKFRNQDGNTWLKRLPNTTARLALRDVVHSYEMFFHGHNAKPKFKTKKYSPKSFKTRNDRFYFTETGVRIEGLGRKGSPTIPIHFDCGFRDTEKYVQPTINVDKLGRYWVSFSIEECCKNLDTPKTEPIGIDLGVRKTITLSTGEIFNKPKEKIARINKHISRVQRHITRDIKRRQAVANHTKTKYDDIPKSKRSLKRENHMKKLYEKRTNIKRNFYFSVANNIVRRNPESVVMETISITKMIHQEPFMSKIMMNSDFYTITQIIKNKCSEYDINFIQADKEYLLDYIQDYEYEQ